jgi:tetratricopeptide (TPR) repeat protein
MPSFDDLPQRPSAHDTEGAAENAFAAAIEACDLFLQQKDRSDYGTDLQIEARQGASMTNLRVHVQLKGTEKPANVDGSISIEVARANLNYLLMQPDSVYVCYHLPTKRLLVRYVQDVFREYEHQGERWHDQETVTVRFVSSFDEEFQRRLNAKVVASGRTARDQRLEWTATPPSEIPAKVRRTVPLIEVPADPGQARELLTELYEDGQDLTISASFSRFAAVLDPLPGAMNFAYMAEINLGLNRLPFDEARVRRGIQVLEEAMKGGGYYRGPLLYSQGNAWMALREFEKARDAYHAALAELVNPALIHVAAQCSKNMGSALKALGHPDSARAFYERALSLDPDLGEAHLALGLWHRNHDHDFQRALEHLDSILHRMGSTLEMSTVLGWRIELLFKTRRPEEAFREIQTLLGEAGRLEWVWPWCARQVLTYGRVSVEATQKAVRFWRAYLRMHESDKMAQKELLLGLLYLRAEDVPTEVGFEEFRREGIRLIESWDSEAAFLWDRIGHWAQYDGNWMEAEKAYRKAYELEPEQFAYCFGTSLNFLDRHEEALAVLRRQAESPEADAMSWFQMAIALEGVGDLAGGIASYERALQLDPDYALAWFNLGGLYWNSLQMAQAASTWKEAVRRFPDHELAGRLRSEMPFLFTDLQGA